MDDYDYNILMQYCTFRDGNVEEGRRRENNGYPKSYTNEERNLRDKAANYFVKKGCLGSSEQKTQRKRKKNVYCKDVVVIIVHSLSSQTIGSVLPFDANHRKTTWHFCRVFVHLRPLNFVPVFTFRSKSGSSRSNFLFCSFEAKYFSEE